MSTCSADCVTEVKDGQFLVISSLVGFTLVVVVVVFNVVDVVAVVVVFNVVDVVALVTTLSFSTLTS